jgi:hypothetical protein
MLLKYKANILPMENLCFVLFQTISYLLPVPCIQT